MSGGELSIAGVARSLARTPEILRLVTADLSDADWRAHPAPERWSPLEILCHLRDEEQEDFGARLRVVLAGGGEFAPIRPAEWVTERRYRAEDPLQVRAEFERRRQGTIELVRSLRPEQLAAVGKPANGGFELNGNDVLAAWVAHDLLHLRQLLGTLARLWGNTHPALKVDYAGELPYPPPAAASQGSG
jgi:DinB superfamily